MASPAPSTDSTQGGTQFIPQSDDEQTLWRVVEITAERPKHYKVKWDGLNPDTGRPWAQSWVPKGDCTDDLRKEWKKKLLRKEEAKKAGKGKSRLSSARISTTPSTSTVNGGRNRSATATVTGSRPPESNSTSRAAKTPQASKRKRRSEELVVDHRGEHSAREVQVVPEPEPGPGPSRPRKRRKIQTEVDKPPPQPQESQEQESYEVVKNKKYGKVVPNDSDFQEEVWETAKVVLKGNVKGKMKGKHKERPAPEVDVPATKMGPPRGVKKNLLTTAKSKSKSTRSVTKSQVLPPLKLISKPTKSKPSPKRFRSPPVALVHTDQSPTKSTKQLPPTDNIDSDNGVDNEDDMNLGYPDLPEQPHDSLFLPSSDDGYEERELRPPAASEMPNSTTPDVSNAVDDIQKQPSEPQTHSYSPSIAGLPAFSLPDPEASLPGGLGFSPEVPETQSQNSSNVQLGVDEPRPNIVTVQSDPLQVSPTTSDIPPKSSTTTPKSRSRSKSKSKPDGPMQPVAPMPMAKPAPSVHVHQISKPLYPVPQISPSTFHPHLRVRTPTPTPGREEAEMADSPSDIEYFSSPEKQRAASTRRLESIRNWGSNEKASGGSQRDSILDIDDALKARREELVDNEHGKHEKETAKRIFSDLINASSQDELDRTDESIIVQEMVDAYVDLSGGGGDDVEESQVVHLPQEEEESTQDLEREREQGVKQQVGEDGDVQQRAISGSGTGQEVNIETSTEPLPAACASTIIDHIAPEPTLSTSTPATPADVTIEEFPPTLSPPRPPTPDIHAMTRSQSAPVQSPSHRLRDAMSLLNVKSDEISKLETSLAVERSNVEALTVKAKRLEDDLASAQALTSQPSPDAIALAELQIQRAQEQVSWDAERAAFIASLDVLKSSKALAETDRDFFRDQYSQASAYVSTVRGENAELEQRAQVAEGKARDGVGMIRAMFEGQVKALQGDLAQWKGIALLLQEKDKRTGDEIRRKAAEEPELRAKYAESRREVEKLEGVVFELLRERNVLKRKLDSVREQAERTNGGKRGDALNGTEVSHSEELVYRCLWRPGGDTKPCLNIFSSPKDLELHMYADEHLVGLHTEQSIPSQGNVNEHIV